ncbi:MAG: OmpH family outer membrane protein [Deferribacteraceae bacterium]|jgi:outer membrane protein|nr:OmpH family outer membrane protein [Deferribacteraceae bacterium]
MKRVFVVLTVVFMTVVSSSAMAQMKVGLVDIQRCVYESEAGKKLIQEMRNMQTSSENQIKAKQDEIKKMQDDYLEKEKSKALTEKAKTDRAQAIQDKIIELNEFARKLNMEIQKKDRDSTEKMEPELRAVIATVAKGDKLDLVLYLQAVAYAPNAVDITQKVIDQYNKQKPK